MANDNLGSGWSNQNDFQVADFSSQNSKTNTQLQHKKQTLFEFISDIQRMSVMESKSDDDFDKDLFTIKESLQGFKHGMILGIYANILLFIHLFIVLIFSFEIITNKFNSQLLINFIYYLPSIIIVVSTLYISTLSKLAVGAYTNKAIKTFFTGKLIGSLIVGIIVLIVTTYIFNLAQVKVSLLLNMNFDFIGLSSTEVYNGIINFIDKKEILYFELSLLLFVSTVLPFLIYSLRKYFFTIDNQQAYEDY